MKVLVSRCAIKSANKTSRLKHFFLCKISCVSVSEVDHDGMCANALRCKLHLCYVTTTTKMRRERRL